MEVFSDIQSKGGMYVKNYEIPNMEIIKFIDQDIIRTSDGDLNGYDSGDNDGTSIDDLFGPVF